VDAFHGRASHHGQGTKRQEIDENRQVHDHGEERSEAQFHWQIDEHVQFWQEADRALLRAEIVLICFGRAA
jgi:hypothetical protein